MSSSPQQAEAALCPVPAAWELLPRAPSFPQPAPGVVTLRSPWNQGVFQSQEQTVAVPHLPVPPRAAGSLEGGKDKAQVLPGKLGAGQSCPVVGVTLGSSGDVELGVTGAPIRPRSQRLLEPIRGVVHNCSVLLTKKFNKF